MTLKTILFITKTIKKIKHPQPFFKGIGVKDVLEGVEDIKYKNFLNKIVKAEERCSNMGTFLERLKKYSHLEAWALLDVEFKYNIKIKTSDLTKDILKIIKNNNILVDSYSEFILKDKDSHKHLLYINEEYSKYYLEKYINVFYYKGNEIKNLINNLNYEYKTLINYIFRISENEGLKENDTITFLNDYASMQSVIKKW